MKKVLIVPDCHHPFVDKRAWALLLRVAKKLKPDAIITLGDFCDFMSVSSHDKDPARKDRFEDEIQACNDALDELDSVGSKLRVFIAGNHEYRLDRYLSQRAPELHSLVSTKELLRLKQRGWVYVPYRSHYKMGKVYFTHDDGTAGPLANVKARSSYEGNVVIGHTHSMSVNYKGTAKGSSHVGASFGWLGDLSQIDYMHRVKAAAWQHGFGVGYLAKDGTMHMQACPIVGGRVVVGGVAY